MESVFARGDSGVDRYLPNDLYDERHPKKKKAKKVQKDVYRHNIGVAPPAYEIASVYTGPVKDFDIVPDSNDNTNKERRNIKKRGKKVIFNVCKCDQDKDENNKGKYIPKTWDSLSKFYGNIDTTEAWNSKNQIIRVHQRKYKNKQPPNYIETNEEQNEYKEGRNKPKANSNIRKTHNQYLKKHSILNDVDQKKSLALEIYGQKPNGTSVISLFRNKNKKRKDTNLQSNHKKRFSTVTGDICNDVLCKEAAKTEYKIFNCKCIRRKKEPDIITKDCTDDTCTVTQQALGVKSLVKIKDKFLCLCRKYSQKFLNSKSAVNTCEEGICREAEINQTHETHNISNNKSKKMSFSLHNIASKLVLLQNVLKQRKKVDDNMVTLEHVSEQTGEPFFEVQVNPRDMCVLNPIDIRENILKYGRPGWNDLKCICPSRGVLKPGEVCASGVCKKAYRNKQTNFKCWCDKRLTECGDTTCGVFNVPTGNTNTHRKKYGKKIIHPRINKPLLEVKLDRDKMCVVNPREIEEKMVNNYRVDDVCFSGICRSNAKDGLPHFCKCVSRKMMSDVTECAEDTCTGVYKKKKWSKSENWSFLNRIKNQKRPTRSSFYEIGPNKLCRGKICSKSDNLHRNNNLNVISKDGKHLQPCNCEECKANKSKTSSPKGAVIKSQRTKNNLTENNIIKQPHKTAATITCTCAHTCECDLDEAENELDEFKHKDKMERERLAQKMHSKKMSRRMSIKEMKRRAKLDKQKEKQAAKERLKEIKEMQQKMKEEPLDSNVCSAFLLSIVKVVLKSVIFVFYVMFSIITDPKGSFWYVRDRVMNPTDTYKKCKKNLSDALLLKKLQIIHTIRGSDALTILADEVLDSSLYQSLANKGRTRKDQMMFEQKSKTRKRRIRIRQQQAIYSCRHNLLTTLRKTPCLWVYHICPNFYPQCLGLLAFMRNFSHILLFIVAFTCWTPCIISFELCRAILCCFMCTH